MLIAAPELLLAAPVFERASNEMAFGAVEVEAP
jgi:hypothetical protein